MLKHFVIFTFEEKFFKEEHFNEYVDAFPELKKSIQNQRNFNSQKLY